MLDRLVIIVYISHELQIAGGQLTDFILSQAVTDPKIGAVADTLGVPVTPSEFRCPMLTSYSGRVTRILPSVAVLGTAPGSNSLESPPLLQCTLPIEDVFESRISTLYDTLYVGF